MNNTLFYGDNLDILRRKIQSDSVDLCYIDPPFNSKRDYFQIYSNVGKDDVAQAQAFTDTWTWNEWAALGLQEILQNETGAYTRQTVELIKGLDAMLGACGLLAYLISMAQRVNEIWRILKPTGSFYLHCDPAASHYLKLLLDSIFKPRGGDFRNEVIWQRATARSDSHRWNHVHDTIFFYSKGEQFTWNTQYMPYDQKYIDEAYRFIEEGTGRRYTSSDLTASGTRNGSSGDDWRGVCVRAKGLHWMYAIEQLEELDRQGRIIYPKKRGGVPRYKRYLDEMPGVAIKSMITDIPPLSPRSSEKLGYPTQKPEALLERIIKASSNEGDVILDAYCGCGTTVAVAQRLHRQWIGIDITYQSISVILQRLEEHFGTAVVESLTLDGIPRDMASAHALAHKKDDRTRKEFEKWALLTYSRNRAVIQEKKGADKGIDGMAYFLSSKETTGRMVFQVKSGTIKRTDIAALNSDRQREKAELAVLITLEEPTKAMREEALSAGLHHHPLLHRNDPRVQIVTIREMLEEHRRIDMPLGVSVLKSARTVKTEQQQDLTF